MREIKDNDRKGRSWNLFKKIKEIMRNFNAKRDVKIGQRSVRKGKYKEEMYTNVQLKYPLNVH